MRGPFLPISLKLWVGVSIVVAVASAFLFYELSARERTRLVQSKVQSSVMVSNMLAASLAAPLDFEDEEAAKSEIENARASGDVLWAGAFAKNGKLVAGSGIPGFDAPGIPPSTEGASVDESRATVMKRVVSREGKELGFAVVVVTLAPENAQLEDAKARILRLCVVLALATATLLVLVTHFQLIRPLLRLAAAARTLEAGGSNVVVEVRSSDEVGALAKAFNAMTAAVHDRETKLAEARAAAQELLDNMRQAIVVFDGSARVVGVQSHASFELFGREKLTGEPIVDLLYPDVEDWRVERQAFEAWLEVALEADDETWPAMAELAPKEVSLADGTRCVELEMCRLEGADRRIMLLATDVTDKRRLEETRDRQSREMVGMKRILGGAHLFCTFLESAARRLARSAEILGAEEIGEAALTELRRHVHTLKGEAHVYDLTDVVGAARGVEERLGSAPGQDQQSRREIRDALRALEEALEAAKRRFVEIAGADAIERVPVHRPTLEQLLELTRGKDDATSRLVARLSARPFGEIVAAIVDRVPAWAEGAGKKARLAVVGEAELVPQALGTVLSGAIVHLVRNAIAHGIERPDERAANQKEETGTVTLACTSRGATAITITVEDDGAGLGENVGEQIFSAGFSTAERADDLAGRGIGLFAVKKELEQVHYEVALRQGSRNGAKFEIHPTEP